MLHHEEACRKYMQSPPHIKYTNVLLASILLTLNELIFPICLYGILYNNNDSKMSILS